MSYKKTPKGVFLFLYDEKFLDFNNKNFSIKKIHIK